MPGLKRSLRRRREEQHQKYPKKLDAIFDWHTPGHAFVFSAEDGPGVAFVVRCSDEQYARYASAITHATCARIRAADDALALDLFGAHRPIGRLMTSISNDALGVLMAMTDVQGVDEICLRLIRYADESEHIETRVPLKVDRIRLEELHGEPIEIGHGPYCAVTMNVHDATLFVHRFETEEEAEAQLAKNQAANEPFVGLTAH